MTSSLHETIKNKALQLLARREHAIQELTVKLARTCSDPDEQAAHRSVIDTVITQLLEQGYLNETRYVEMMVRSRVGKYHGAMRIRQEIAQWGVPDSLINEVLDEADVDWFDLAKQAKTRRFGEEPEHDAKRKAKQQRYLQQRGFNLDQVRYATESSGEC